MDVAISTLLSPIILFFALGMGAALLRSQMSIPEAFAKGLAIYLMMAIGLKGEEIGYALSRVARVWVDSDFMMERDELLPLLVKQQN